MVYKSIFKGRLEFGSSKSYDKVLKMYQHRLENYYKSDVLLAEEAIFDEATSSLIVPRTVIPQGSEKSWRNTMDILEYVAQFAVAGNLGGWMTDEGKILRHGVVEPRSERSAVQAFLKGRELSNASGMEGEAMKALNQAIDKYERHAQAYERRGHVNYLLKNYKEAIYDFSKSIELANSNAEPFYGRANVKRKLNDHEGSIADFNSAIKTSIPLEAIHWQARRQKATAHFELGQFTEAVSDFKFFCGRKFKPDNPNFKWRRSALFLYGRTLLELEQYDLAITAFEQVLSLQEGSDTISDADKLYYNSFALYKAGKRGYKKGLEEAAKLGSNDATILLKSMKK
jgi:tetratricopeptide (TPR) repeat protein